VAKTVKRIKLSGGKRIVEENPDTEAQAASPSPQNQNEPEKASRNMSLSVLTAPFRYVANSWRELKQVRWPNRRASWGLTLAVILFTAFFSIVILILDALFQILFKEVLLK